MVTEVPRKFAPMSETEETTPSTLPPWLTESAEQEARERERQHAVVAELSQRALASRNLAELLDVAVDNVARTLDVEFACILAREEDSLGFVLRAAVGWPVDAIGRVVVSPDVDSLAGFTLACRYPVVVEDLRCETRFHDVWLSRGGQIVSSLSVVIGDPDHPFGVLTAHSGKVRPFGFDDEFFVQTIANIIAAGIERFRVEEELHHSNQELATALSELQSTQEQMIQQERLRALGEMASGIAHDFNNALAQIVGYCELPLRIYVDDLADPERVRGYFDLIQTAAADAANVVDRLREFYRARSDQDILTPIDVNQLVRQAISLSRPRWRDQALANGITIAVETDLAAAALIEGNESVLRQALINLIFNAVDAMPEGGILRLRTRQGDDHVTLTVEDTGTGMTDDVRKRCLEPFFTTKGTRGSGLGLAMVYGTIRRHRGTVDIQSTPGAGTALAIRLPILRRGRRGRKPKGKGRRALPSLRVLIVEDQAAIRRILTEYLMKDDHRVETAENGADGLRAFLHQTFDLVIVDQAMPEMSGGHLARLIKERSPTTPIILLTGFGRAMQWDGARPPEVDVVVAKPITLNELREAVREVMGRQRQRTTIAAQRD